MSLFRYQYIEKGKKRAGIIEASSDREAKDKLREQGIVVIKIQAQSKIVKNENIRGDNLLAFTIQLSQLINAGVPLYESLTAIEEQARGESYHRILLSLCDQIKAGSSLSQAMATYPDSFDKLYTGMITAGEAVGSLGPVLNKLTTFLDRQMKLKKQITTAMIYPVILGSFSFLIIAVLLGFVVPSLEGIFADRKLNAFTSAVLSISYIFRTYWWLYIPVIGGLSTFAVIQFRSRKGKKWIEKTLLKVPVLKHLVIQTAVARFCRTMGTMLQGGLSMMDSLKISRGVMKNAVLEKEIQLAEGRIIEGQSLSSQLQRSAYFPKLIAKMVAIGEESGTTVQMLNQIADMYEQEIEKTLDRVMALAQPIILIIMGIVIGTVLLAILLPLTDVSSFSVG